MSRRAPLIVAIIVALVAILMVFFVVLPKMGDVGEAEQRLEEAESQQFALEEELSRLQEAEEDAGQLRRELARFRRAVPPVADLAGLIKQLQTAADVAGVDFFSITTGQPVPTANGQATEIPATIQVIGGFFPADTFLAGLETLPRASEAPTITVAAGPAGLPQIDVRVDVRFYTTDLEAGPGAAPPVAPGPETGPAPAASPTPGTETTPATTETTPATGG